MNKKVIFLDVDGTLCNDLGLVPESAAEAIQKAREHGHLVYLCTGRSKAEIYDDIMAIGFDGIIGAGGGFIEHEGNMLVHHKFSEAQLTDILGYFDTHKIEYYVESNHGLFATPACLAHLERISKELQEQGLDSAGCDQFKDALLTLEKDTELSDVNKICFLDSGFPFTTIKERYEAMFTIMPCTVPMFGENSGEVVLKGIHKALAMEQLLAHLQIDKKDTLAIGDGMNDAEMLEYANIGIAMGNAKEGLKKIADDVTGTHDEGGIYQSFQKYGII